LPTDRFRFAGFLPAKAGARATAIAELAGIRATLVLYESGPRLAACLTALAKGLGDRPAAVGRELTKRFEESVTGTLSELAARYAEAAPRGEIVITVGPPGESPPADADTIDSALRAALADSSLKTAVASVTAALRLPRAQIYARALALRNEDGAA
jgi:16S rRNA (cytidine1402-2'-O)-methyltransferase